MSPGLELNSMMGILRSAAVSVFRERANSFLKEACSSLWPRGASLLLLLCGAACTSPPEIYPGGTRPQHDFILGEGYRGQIRKIDVWFEPGHVLQWELIRSGDPERRKIPLATLDYGETPASMDQIFPSGFANPPQEGQITSVALEYGTEGDPDPIVRGVLTRWFQKKAHSFSELSEQEAEAEAQSRKASKEEKH